MIRVLLADNQVLTREGLKSILADILDIHIIASAARADELEQMIIKHQPDIVIVDHDYNSRITIQDIENLISGFDFRRVLVLSNKQSKNEILKITNLGIKNFVFKECSREELVTAIYKTANGEQFFCKNTFKTLFGNQLLPEKEEAMPQLSARETELVHLIAEGLTNKEIADRLFLSIHTVKTHRKNIIKKLGFTFKNAADLMLYADKIKSA